MELLCWKVERKEEGGSECVALHVVAIKILFSLKARSIDRYAKGIVRPRRGEGLHPPRARWKIITPGRGGICSLEAYHEKAEGLCFGSPSKQPSARRVADCLMVDCRAPLRGSSDWVAAKHLPASRGAPRRQSSYNREVIHRKTSSFGWGRETRRMETEDLSVPGHRGGRPDPVSRDKRAPAIRLGQTWTEIKLLGGNGGRNVTILIIFSIDLKIGRKESYDSEGNDSSSMDLIIKIWNEFVWNSNFQSINERSLEPCFKIWV